MQTFTLVRPEHLNHHGSLFGGVMLKWIDEIAWMAATRDYPGCRLVTLAMNNILFKKPVRNGSILRFVAERLSQGRTSVRYGVVVHADRPGAKREDKVFSTEVTFVRIDGRGRKRALPKSNVQGSTFKVQGSMCGKTGRISRIGNMESTTSSAPGQATERTKDVMVRNPQSAIRNPK
jgi:acyl-CoA hydrolase